jgi:hypothetical protein
MLVAWYVNKWYIVGLLSLLALRYMSIDYFLRVEPLLYRTIVFEDPIEGYPAFDKDTLLRAIHSKPASFFRNSVRHLKLNYYGANEFTNEDTETIISACSGIVNLSVANENILRDSFTHLLPLKRLYTQLGRIFNSSPVHFTQPLLSQLTHLEVFDFLDDFSDTEHWACLATLSQLTHLAFNCQGIFPVFRRILHASSSLQILILLTRHFFEPSIVERDKPVVEDIRFVGMPCLEHHRDWQRGVHAGQDYWTRAEEFVARRRLGTENRACFIFPRVIHVS